VKRFADYDLYITVGFSKSQTHQTLLGKLTLSFLSWCKRGAGWRLVSHGYFWRGISERKSFLQLTMGAGEKPSGGFGLVSRLRADPKP